jgi:hypothetical protein
VATGRSDYPNQVNNVLGFPFIFRGALDVRATTINEAMKIAAVKALAQLAREDVPDSVIRAYGGKPIRFGPDYIIPKPLDTRVLLTVAPAVARAAVESGVARIELGGDRAYADRLEARLGTRAGDHAAYHHSRSEQPQTHRPSRGEPSGHPSGRSSGRKGRDMPTPDSRQKDEIIALAKTCKSRWKASKWKTT